MLSALAFIYTLLFRSTDPSNGFTTPVTSITHTLIHSLVAVWTCTHISTHHWPSCQGSLGFSRWLLFLLSCAPLCQFSKDMWFILVFGLPPSNCRHAISAQARACTRSPTKSINWQILTISYEVWNCCYWKPVTKLTSALCVSLFNSLSGSNQLVSFCFHLVGHENTHPTLIWNKTLF